MTSKIWKNPHQGRRGQTRSLETILKKWSINKSISNISNELIDLNNNNSTVIPEPFPILERNVWNYNYISTLKPLNLSLHIILTWKENMENGMVGQKKILSLLSIRTSKGPEKLCWKCFVSTFWQKGLMDQSEKWWKYVEI